MEIKETNNVDVNAENTAQNAETETAKTYTQDELLALIQSESDRRVTEALKKVQKKHEKELSLSKLDGDAREKAEKDNEIAELREKLAQFEIEKNRSELKSVLSSRGLSAEFADIIVINDDLEQSQENIDKLDKLFKKAVTAEVEKRLAGSAPKGNGTTSPGTVTKESFRKMSLAAQQALRQSEPELYNSLTRQ